MGAAEAALAGLVTDQAPWSAEAKALGLDALTDTLAIGVAGAGEEQSRIARSTVLPNEHPDTVGTWSGAGRFALADAAFLAGLATHSLDWDDYLHPMHGHCSAALLATAWPVAEYTGASGAELLDAFLVGYRIDYLASLALGHGHYRRGWHATSTVATLGAAAVASRHGVQAAQLARAGATGSADWLLGSNGMLAVFGGDVAGQPATQAAAVILEAGRSPGGGNGIRRNGIQTEWGRCRSRIAAAAAPTPRSRRSSASRPSTTSRRTASARSPFMSTP
jgi:2-methylcitrate dehydratase PrpD